MDFFSGLNLKVAQWTRLSIDTACPAQGFSKSKNRWLCIERKDICWKHYLRCHIFWKIDFEIFDPPYPAEDYFQQIGLTGVECYYYLSFWDVEPTRTITKVLGFIQKVQEEKAWVFDAYFEPALASILNEQHPGNTFSHQAAPSHRRVVVVVVVVLAGGGGGGGIHSATTRNTMRHDCCCCCYLFLYFHGTSMYY